ncbi:hypothetical protein GGE65_004695 [Skermanella aerolata]|uniref:hypothetical protein n=1 Tax=Skermanella aerolata TaxID=393310 RepID=UPI003D238B00
MLKYNVDASGAKKLLEGHARQIPYAVSKAVNGVAKDAAAAATASIPVKFDKPNAFTQKAVSYTPATKSSPTATVFVKDAQASYLRFQEEGGTRTPEPKKPVLFPEAVRLNASGNIPRGSIQRSKRAGLMFEAKPGDSRTAHLKPGLYLRPNVKGNKRGKAPKLMVSVGKQAQYRPRFGFADTVKQAVYTNFQKRLEEAVEHALKTAR